MSLVIGFIIIFIVCALAARFLPAPRYGRLRGCTGRALQEAMDREDARKTTAPGQTEHPGPGNSPGA